MSVIDFPTDIPIRATGWAQPESGVIRQRSIFTGRTTDVRLGPSARWTCRLEWVPTTDVLALDRMRAFLAHCMQPGAGFRLEMVEGAQAVSPVPATALVNGAGQLGQTLNIDGLPNTTAILRAGQLVSVALASDDEFAAVVRAAVTSNGSGQAALSLSQPLRRAPADNAVVRLHSPRAVMRLDPAAAMQWLAQPGPIYSFEALTAEEWF